MKTYWGRGGSAPLGEYINTKNTEDLLQASRGVGLEVNTEKIEYIVVSSPKYRTKS
jgi:hypothetical protein